LIWLGISKKINVMHRPHSFFQEENKSFTLEKEGGYWTLLLKAVKTSFITWRGESNEKESLLRFVWPVDGIDVVGYGWLQTCRYP